ncbi:MAG: Crp/Fnr family transcriptional regulator [Acidobacteriia bacterium]|nr:Crp/Fnr family transcriptional regulator [Terriglobia bacterium]
MGVPRRFAIPNDCLSCTLRRECDFCNLPPDLLGEFNAMGHLTLFPADATLLTEGEIPRGVYILCSGRAKLAVQARDGKTVILKIAGDRHLVGLSAVVSGRPSPVTVTTIELCQIKFVEQVSILHLLEHNSVAALACARLLAAEVGTTFDDVYDLLLARSSTEKLARLLLSWVAGEPRNRDLRVSTDFTHEEMAQMIGSSRETVTRLLSDMKRKELIRREGSTLIIPNRIALQAIAS